MRAHTRSHINPVEPNPLCLSRCLTLTYQMDYNGLHSKQLRSRLVERLPQLQQSAPSIKTAGGSGAGGGQVCVWGRRRSDGELPRRHFGQQWKKGGLVASTGTRIIQFVLLFETCNPYRHTFSSLSQFIKPWAAVFPGESGKTIPRAVALVHKNTTHSCKTKAGAWCHPCQ